MAFTFVKDRKPQGLNFGPGGAPCRADSSKYHSIWGKVDGTGSARFTAAEILNGDIVSQDGRASIGGVPVIFDGKPNIATANGCTYQEFQIPKDDIEKWNAYEAAQSNEKSRQFLRDERAKAHVFGREPDLRVDHLDVDVEPVQFNGATAQSEPQAATKIQSGWTPERKAAHSAKMKARHAAKAAAQTAAA